MSQQQLSDVNTPKETKEVMTPSDVNADQYPDAQEPKPETAGISLILIIGSIFLTMIVVMVIAFTYYNNFWEGPTSLVLPFLA